MKPVTQKTAFRQCAQAHTGITVTTLGGTTTPSEHSNLNATLGLIKDINIPIFTLPRSGPSPITKILAGFCGKKNKYTIHIPR